MFATSHQNVKSNQYTPVSIPSSSTARLMYYLKIVKSLFKKTPIEDWAVDYNNHHLEDSQLLQLFGWLDVFNPDAMIQKNLFVRLSKIHDDFIDLVINTNKLDNYGFLPDQTRNKIEKYHKVRILLFTQEFLDIYYNVPIQYSFEKYHKNIRKSSIKMK
jgi:hypothetical protein